MARRTLRTAPLAFAVLLAGCSSEDDSFEYPLDDVLRFNHVQTKGTHNSYHMRPDHDTVPDWDYEHVPLDQQLSTQGVRQFELDLYFNLFDSRFDVQHVPQLDPNSTCPQFVECLQVIKSWSDDNPAHHPIVVMLEPKDPVQADIMQQYYELLDEEVFSVWPVDRIVTPELVQGDAADVRTAITTDGWPTLGELRGKIMFVLLDSGEQRDFLVSGQAAGGDFIFPDARDAFDQPWAAYALMDDPISREAEIIDVVGQGFLIRTRANSAPLPTDPARLPAALAAGGHFISTDYPSEWDIPDGAPSRCNPQTAPASCTAIALEDPQFID